MQKLVSQNEKLSKEIKDLREQIMAAMEKSKKKTKGAKSGKEEDPAISFDYFLFLAHFLLIFCSFFRL